MDKATILGTSSAFPTKLRNHPAVYLNLEGNTVLLDCGEGTQRQIRVAELSPSVDYIFLTHWHGDHSLGVAGILQSMNMIRREEPVFIFGPQGTNSSISNILKTYKFYASLPIKSTALDLKREKSIVKIGRYTVYGLNVKHSVKCLGYKIKEDDSINIRQEMLKKYGVTPGPFLKALKSGKNVKYKGKVLKAKDFTYLKRGKSLVYLTDLVYEKKLVKFAKDADVLIIEATFSSALQEKAKEAFHLTIADALTLAKEASVKAVYLVHTSQRYESSSVSLKNEIAGLKDKLRLNAEVFLPDDLSKIEFC